MISKMINRKLFFGILAVGVLVAVWNLLIYDDKQMTEGVFLWEGGEEKFIASKNSDLGDFLMQTIHKLNLQARCAFSEERVQKIKQNSKVVELRFRNPVNITISQWVEPEERKHILADEKGYRILRNVKIALFILEDYRDENLEGNILIGHEIEGRIGYSCWAIQKEGSEKIDKTWIYEINKTINHIRTE